MDITNAYVYYKHSNNVIDVFLLEIRVIPLVYLSSGANWNIQRPKTS